jgi:hypothetical protein
VRFAELSQHEQWLLQIRLSRLEQKGLRDKRNGVSSFELFSQGYTHAPREMSTDRVDFLLLYGMEPGTTLFADLPWISRKMKLDVVGGERFDTEAEGVGDLRLGVVHEMKRESDRVLLATLGVSIPTGSVDERDRDETGTSVTLPYAMQLGTGTFDLHPGLTWMRQSTTWSFGAQSLVRIHLGQNDRDWSRSNEGEISTWVARSLSASVAASLRVRALFWGDLHGAETNLDPDRNPLEDRSRQGGERYELIGGVNWQLGDGVNAVRSLSLELGVPVEEWLDGPGLSTHGWAAMAWRYSF